MNKKLNPKFIEYIHDVLIGSVLLFDQPVIPGEYRDWALIESAAARPFHTAFGTEIWPSPFQKAAALFHSLACNHCFLNGNKRTAVMGLDYFLAANFYVLAMSSEQIYELATTTAKANEEGRGLESVIDDLSHQIEESTMRMDETTEAKLRALTPEDLIKVKYVLERIKELVDRAVAAGIPIVIPVEPN